jgi:hypothetical protein
LLLAPALATSLQGEALEAVSFLRDEMVNQAWAVETRVADGLGESRDAFDRQRRIREILAQSPSPPTGPGAPNPPSPMAASPAASAPLKYLLGSSVPENWIPFIPVHKPEETRAIRLQRASMPRFLLDAVRPIRPVTQLLRAGLGDDQRQSAPYFINEEEIPRTGLAIAEGYQRARWLQGRTVVWLGRRRTSGRGEGSSGLRFERVERSG